MAFDMLECAEGSDAKERDDRDPSKNQRARDHIFLCHDIFFQSSANDIILRVQAYKSMKELCGIKSAALKVAALF
jgi:hypothetical protein